MSRKEGSGFFNLFRRKPKAAPAPVAPAGPSCDDRIIEVLRNEGYNENTPVKGASYKIGAVGEPLMPVNSDIMRRVYTYVGKETEKPLAYSYGNFAPRDIHTFTSSGNPDYKISSDKILLKEVGGPAPSPVSGPAPLPNPFSGGKRRTAHKQRKQRKHRMRTCRKSRK